MTLSRLLTTSKDDTRLTDDYQKKVALDQQKTPVKMTLGEQEIVNKDDTMSTDDYKKRYQITSK